MAEPDAPADQQISQSDLDREDRNHHRRVMTIAIIAIALLLGAMVWVANMIVEQQKLERCLASGRRDCLIIEAPQRTGDTDKQPSANQK